MNKVIKHVLKNGLTVLLYPTKRIPKVSAQIWYNVGSKDEREGQRGLAHLLEHMIFKGTKKLSESDINVISHKLSGYCNAFTSYDYTGYLFDFPKQHWEHALSIFADCMRNCTFDQEMLNSEMKAVIQELKMYRDDYQTSIKEELVSALFAGHPYHYPIIGYKQDLWSVSSDDLHAFYQEHYIPNNATLVLVGDLDPDIALQKIQEHFGSLEPNFSYKKKHISFTPDFKNVSVTLARQVQQPLLVCAVRLPGLKKRDNRAVECLTWLLAEGKGSRLQKKLIDELGWVTDIESEIYNLFEEDVLFISLYPTKQNAIEDIKRVIQEEIAALETIDESEFDRACKQAHIAHTHVFESTQELAYHIGSTYLATQDPQKILVGNYQDDAVKKELKNLIATCFRTINLQWGHVVPLAHQDEKMWADLQQKNDDLDTAILSKKNRSSAVQPARLAHTIKPEGPTPFSYDKGIKHTLENGLTVLKQHRDGDKVDLVLELKASYQNDPIDKQGLQHFGMQMLLQGTKDYPHAQLAQSFESHGILYDVDESSISLSMLSSEVPHAIKLLNQMLCHATFDDARIEKVRASCLSDIDQFWDTPTAFSTHLIREKLYENHSLAQNSLGTKESITQITKDDLLDWYKRCVVPAGARLAVVGQYDNDIDDHIEQYLGVWRGNNAPTVSEFKTQHMLTTPITYTINRDQIVVCFAGLSVTRKDPDYDKLLIFDQLFGGGVLGSMNSYLFQLREESGLFYTIRGSLVYDADEYPGMTMIKTIVSADRLNQAEEAIGNTINTALDKVTQEEFDHAKQILINNLVDNFESNHATAQALIFVDRFGFENDYFDKRAEHLSAITLDEMKQAVVKHLHTDKLMRCYVGRLK